MNCAKISSNCAKPAMSTTANLLNSILSSENGLTLAELLTRHPDIARRTAQRLVAKHVPKNEQPNVQALIVEELRRLHEGVLARYSLRPSEYAAWKASHGY